VDLCILADSLSLSDLLGDPVLLFFFDAGSRASQTAYRHVRNWVPKYRADSLVVVGFHCPEFKPLKDYENAATTVSAADLKIPVGMDFESEVRDKYGLETLPAFVLLNPAGDIIFQTSDPAQFRALEERIQELLLEIKPGTILPFIFEPRAVSEKVKPTPEVRFGPDRGSIVGADSSGFGRFKIYTDSRGRDRGRVYLQGRWKIEDDALHYVESETSHLRVLYSGKDVWVLPESTGETEPRVLIMQDRSYLRPELWGKDIKVGVDDGIPYIEMRRAVPKHIVSNPDFGTHELRLIPAEGDVRFYYIHFEGDLSR
jgi:hypothetical protein